MPQSDPIVLASVLTPFQAFVDRRGGDSAALLAAVGLSAEDISDPKRYLSLNAVAQLFDLAAKRTEDPSFGLHYAENYPPGGSGLIGHLMLTAPTVGDMLRVIVDYLEVYTAPMRPELVAHNDEYRLGFAFPPSFTAPQLHYSGFLLVTLVRRLRLAAGTNWRPRAAEFAHRAPERIDDYASYFGRSMTFNARGYQVSIAAETLDKPMPQLATGLFDSVRDLADRILKEARLKQDITEQILVALSQRLGADEKFSLDLIAGDLGTQPRALQWRLEQAGTTYERQLSRARRRLAVQLLRDTDLSITVIALRLGYSEASAFARAAQNWFSDKPTAVRQRLREKPPHIE